MTEIHESPAAGAVLVVVALPEYLAVTDDGSGPVAMLNDAPFLYHDAREDRRIEPEDVIAATNGLVRVTDTARRLVSGSGVDASHCPHNLCTSVAKAIIYISLGSFFLYSPCATIFWYLFRAAATSLL